MTLAQGKHGGILPASHGGADVIYDVSQHVYHTVFYSNLNLED